MTRPLRLLLTTLILAALAWYLWHARHDLAILIHFDPRFAPPMLLVPLASLGVNGLIARALAAELGVRLGLAESYALATLNALGNYLPLPQAGALARGYYLKKVHNLPYTAYAATLAVTYVSALALTGILGLAGLALLAATGRSAPWPLWIIFALLSACLLMFTPAARLVRVPRRLAGFTEGLAHLRRQHLLARIVLMQAALIALTTTGLWLACRALPLAQDVSWPGSLMLALMITAAGIANVTPGNLGVEQGAAELTGRLLRMAPNTGLLASVLFRAMAVLVVFLLSPALGAWLRCRCKKVDIECPA
jgi:hypothetical protein